MMCIYIYIYTKTYVYLHSTGQYAGVLACVFHILVSDSCCETCSELSPVSGLCFVEAR